MLLALLVSAPVLFQAIEASAQLTKFDPSILVGTWEGQVFDPENGEASELRFALWEVGGESGAFEGGLRSGEDTSYIDAFFDTKAGELVFELIHADGSYRAVLAPTDDRETWKGQLLYSETLRLPFTAKRVRESVAKDLVIEADLSVERPLTVDRDDLPELLTSELQKILADWVRRERVVGVSAAYIYDFEVRGIHSVGWENYARRKPATQNTRYRWASISKSVAAVAALQLHETGALDLGRDIRKFVPEFPEKKWVVTAENLLSHQGGIVHYQHGPIRTEREYGDPNPFRDSILALDMFRESPLLHEPGSKYSYSTHGYSLLGAVVERAGKRSFREQVRLRIVERLGLKTLQPDYHQSESIPNQTTGYVSIKTGRTIDSGDSNVAWKLAGGGFISNVEDLALFGLGLMEDGLLRPETRAAMFLARPTSSGAKTNYGWGVQPRRVKGYDTVGHGGSQRKTRTYLRFVPEIGLGVAVMCNTEGTDIEDLANKSLAAMLD